MLTKAELSRLRSLRDKKTRDELGLFVIEGEKVISELLQEKFPFREIYGTARWSGPKTHLVSENEMARASHFPTASPVLAVGGITQHDIAEGDLDAGLTLALDGVQSPGNVGTILRVADWFAFDRVVVSLDSADIYSQKAINASMGSFARVKAFRGDLPKLLQRTRAPILGCDLNGSDIHSLSPYTNAIIVIGNEGRGISAAVDKYVSNRITIPRFGKAESLNAGLAAAIACDNLRRNQKTLRQHEVVKH